MGKIFKFALSPIAAVAGAFDGKDKKPEPVTRYVPMPEGSELAASPAKRALRKQPVKQSILDAESDRLGG